MRCDYFTNSLTGRRAGVHRTSNRRHVAAYDCCHEARVDLLPTDQTNVRSFDHRVGGLDHRDESTAFNHSQCFRQASLPAQINLDRWVNCVTLESAQV